jgi:hypothetical protein
VLKKVFQDCNSYDLHFPPEIAFVRAQKAGRELLRPDVAWIQQLQGGESAFVKFMHNVYSNSYDQEVRDAWKDTRSFDLTELLEKCEGITHALKEVHAAFDAEVAARTTVAQQTDVAATIAAVDAPGGMVEQEGADSKDDQEASDLKQMMNTAHQKVSDLVSSRFSFVEAGVAMGADLIQQAIESNEAYKAFKPQWKVAHRVFVFDLIQLQFAIQASCQDAAWRHSNDL